MLLKDIRVLEGISPIKLVKKPGVKTLELLHNLIQTKDMESFIANARIQFKIPKDGMDITQYLGLNFYDIGDININAIKLITDDFVRSTGLPKEYALAFALVVLFNSIIDLRFFKHEPAEPLEFVFGRRKIADKMWEYSHEVGAIIVPFDISKTKLKKWIEKQWDSIVDNIDTNFTTNPFILGIHENLLLEEEINQLKNVENKSFSEILKIFKQKYPKDNWKRSRIIKIYYDAKQRKNLADTAK